MITSNTTRKGLSYASRERITEISMGRGNSACSVSQKSNLDMHHW